MRELWLNGWIVFKIFSEKEFLSSPIPAGIYHYQSPPDADNPYRLHLRLEKDGRGLLIINAHTTLHLNQTAAEFAYYIIQGYAEDKAVAEITRRYNIKA